MTNRSTTTAPTRTTAGVLRGLRDRRHRQRPDPPERQPGPEPTEPEPPPPPDPRRIMGLETEYGLAFIGGPLGPEPAARELFEDVVAWGRSTNVFLTNGARLYLDVGSHPEYATAECSTITELIAQDRAGQAILCKMVESAAQRLAERKVPGQIHLFKNNLDSAGHSYGSHENYLIRRQGDLAALHRRLIPFLVARQILAGAGHVLVRPDGARYVLSQRADQMWEAVSSSTTRSRPMINTRDEAHADANLYRRLHVIVGDSSMSETACRFKFGSMDLVLRTFEAGARLPDLALADPMAAIRAISHDPSGRATVELANGGCLTGCDILETYLDEIVAYLFSDGDPTPTDAAVLDLWRRGIDAVRSGDLSTIENEVDWVIKQRLIDRLCERDKLDLLDPKVARLELAYHDIGPDGFFGRLEAAGQVAKVIDQAAITEAVDQPPQTTRALLRGRFIGAARAAGRPYTVDWVHLKLGQPGGRTVALLDPFATQDDQAEALIATLTGPGEVT